jgi:CheY-like chemotaxis protein
LAEDAGSGPLVLVVDDLGVHLELARSILEPSGYRVITASGATEALRMARRHRCDVILSDVCMSEGSGLELVRAVRADPGLRRLPIILLTSTYTNEKERAKGLSLGADDYLFRPIEPEALLAAISARLQAARSV